VNIAVYHNLPSGGAKRALFNYTKGLTEQGHGVDVYAPPSADEQFLDLRPLVRRYVTIPLRTAPGLVTRWLATRELARYVLIRWSLVAHARAAAAAIDAGGYDIAFVHHCQFAQAPYVLGFLATPSVYYCQEPRRSSFEYSILHDEDVDEAATGPKSPAVRTLRWAHTRLFESTLRPRDIAAARSATLILANSFFSVESIKRAYGRYAKVAYLGIEPATFHASGQPRRRAVVSVGALHPTKGHRLVLDAVAAVPEAQRPVVDIVADRGLDGYAEALTEDAGRLGVTLNLHERITDAELVELYATARVAVCGAELEPFGFTPLEAMACGTPVVAVREGGYKETVIDGQNGRLVERDPGALGGALAAILGDEATWGRLSRGALETVDRWSVGRATETLERILGEVRAARGCAPDRA
jgi:glycosyltransferase involved in cell wall biosynthesis